MFTPIPGEMIQFDGAYFSNGLVQPPTSETGVTFAKDWIGHVEWIVKTSPYLKG